MKKYFKKIRKNKKGTEKPIEIFIALFIILAVSMVMLKMFKGQITEKSQQMQDENAKYQLEQSIKEAKLTCSQLCSDANQQGCSGQTIAAYCTQTVGTVTGSGENERRVLDLDANNVIGVDTSLMGGIGVCEDAIYCPLVHSCKCGKELTPQYCIEKSCEYWDKLNMDANKILLKQIPEPSDVCKSANDFDYDLMWFKNIAKDCNDALGIKKEQSQVPPESQSGNQTPANESS
jgi:hypothetical protein